MEGVSSNYINTIIDKLDGNGDGIITFQELRDWLYPPRNVQALRRCLKDIFDFLHNSVDSFQTVFDPDGSHTIGRVELLKGLRDARCFFTNVELDLLYGALLDFSGKKHVSFREFCGFIGVDTSDAPKGTGLLSPKTAGGGGNDEG